MASRIARFMGPTWAHLGPTGPRWAPCWPHEVCYLGCYEKRDKSNIWFGAWISNKDHINQFNESSHLYSYLSCGLAERMLKLYPAVTGQLEYVSISFDIIDFIYFLSHHPFALQGHHLLNDGGQYLIEHYHPCQSWCISRVNINVFVYIKQNIDNR